MNAKYNSLNEIKTDLKRYKLEQQIALEELKLVKNRIQHDFTPIQNVKNSVLKVVTVANLIRMVYKRIRPSRR